MRCTTGCARAGTGAWPHSNLEAKKKQNTLAGCTLREMHVSVYFRNKLREIGNRDQNDRKCNDTFSNVMEDNYMPKTLKK